MVVVHEDGKIHGGELSVWEESWLYAVTHLSTETRVFFGENKRGGTGTFVRFGFNISFYPTFNLDEIQQRFRGYEVGKAPRKKREKRRGGILSPSARGIL